MKIPTATVLKLHNYKDNENRVLREAETTGLADQC